MSRHKAENCSGVSRGQYLKNSQISAIEPDNSVICNLNQFFNEDFEKMQQTLAARTSYNEQLDQQQADLQEQLDALLKQEEQKIEVQNCIKAIRDQNSKMQQDLSRCQTKIQSVQERGRARKSELGKYLDKL